MRTPLKYGKRKRLLNTSDQQWDAAIDVSPRPTTPQPTSAIADRSPNPSSPDPFLQPSPVKRSTGRKAEDVDLDVFDFERDTKERRARQKAQDILAKNEVTHSPRQLDPGTERAKSSATGSNYKAPVKIVHRPEARPKEDVRKAATSANDINAVDNIGESTTEIVSIPTQISPLRRSPRNTTLRVTSDPNSLPHTMLDQNLRKVSTEKRNVSSPAKKRLSDVKSPPKPEKRIVSSSKERLEEVDLEPIIRTKTPLPFRLPIPSNKSPQVSPEQRRVFDIFDTSQADSRPNVGTGKLLASLTKSRSARLQDTSQTSVADRLPLGKLLENAENELVEFSQPMTVPEVESASSGDSPVPELFESPAQPVSASQPTKATYGRQRSFLAEPLPHENDQISRYSPPISNDGTDEDEEAVSSNNVVIKNLHDLRQGGENRRFVDDALYLLEGFDSPSSIQGTLLELAIKLLNRDFARKFHAAGFESRVEGACKNLDDPITMFAASVIISANLQQSGKDGSTSLTKTQERILSRALQYDRPISAYLNDKSVKASKFNKVATKELATAIEKTEVFQKLPQGYDLSPRLLSLMCFFLQTTMQQKTIVNLVLPLLKDSVVYRVGNLVEKQMIISSLEMLEPDMLKKLTTNHLEQLRDTAKNILDHDDDDEQIVEQATTILSGILRMLIGIVNQSPAAIGVIATTEFVGSLLRHVHSHGATVSENADDIVLCLGLLVSLTEEDQAGGLTKVIIVQSLSKYNLVDALSDRLSADRKDMMTGYLALLLFHVLYGGGNDQDASVASIDTLQSEGRLLVRHGLEILRDATGEVPELQNRLAQHLSVVA